VVAALFLGGCASDTLRDSVRPTAEEKASQRTLAPAGSVAALMRVGDSARAAGDSAAAIPFYRRAHALDFFNPDPLVRLGAALSDLGAYNEAVQAYRDALRADPVNTAALRGLGNALISLNQPQLAVEQFDAALRIEDDHRNYNGIGVALDRIGDHKGAQAHYRVGLQTAPGNLTLLNNLGLSLALSGDDEEAIKTLERVARHPRATARHRQNLALAYGLAGRTSEAARIAQLDLDEADVRSNLAYYGLLRAMNEEGLDAATAIDVQMTGEGEAGSPF
jgi:Flp pilus assembly protein TadD